MCKDKLTKLGHKKPYYVFKRMCGVSLATLVLGASVVVPVTFQIVEYAKAEQQQNSENINNSSSQKETLLTYAV